MQHFLENGNIDKQDIHIIIKKCSRTFGSKLLSIIKQKIVNFIIIKCSRTFGSKYETIFKEI